MQGLCNDPSVRPSVPSFDRSRTAAGEFAAERRAAAPCTLLTEKRLCNGRASVSPSVRPIDRRLASAMWTGNID